ncbi:MAG: hypothetical protein JSV84_05700 [Gemmatimonadota bacterium]|nr:MAG: hypothetical protein JSV84_05700 [Gemmatimonadota bacterium]
MKKVFAVCVIVLFGLLNCPEAQECGPSCPVCSGSGDNTGALLTPRTLLATVMYLPTGEEEKGVSNLRYGVVPWLDVGIGYTIEAEKPIWGARIHPISEIEDGWRPGLILGTGSVQTGGSDQSIFAQLTKSWEFNEGYAFRLSGGFTSLVPDFERCFGLAGLTATVTERLSSFVSYDGRNFHLGLSWIPTDWFTIAGLLVETRDPAISLGYRWCLSD